MVNRFYLYLKFQTAKLLENDVPIFVVTFTTQEIIVFKNAKTGEIAFGKDVFNINY